MKHRSLITAAFLLAIACLDGVLKYIAITRFPTENTPGLSPIVAFVFHKNPGITFDIPLPITIIIPITIGIILALAYHARTMQPRALIGNLAIIIGALDNLIDRILNGFTTDYLMFFKTSVINLADVLILFGGITLLLYYTSNPHQRRA